jgi:hypothetical protein
MTYPACKGDCGQRGAEHCPHPEQCQEGAPWPFSGRWSAIDVVLLILLCVVVADMLERAYR